MIALLISIMISLGLISSEADYYDLSPAQQEAYQQQIIIDDTVDL